MFNHSDHRHKETEGMEFAFELTRFAAPELPAAMAVARALSLSVRTPPFYS
jgi:hypothetical protein